MQSILTLPRYKTNEHETKWLINLYTCYLYMFYFLIYIQNTGIKREKTRFSAKTHALFC